MKTMIMTTPYLVSGDTHEQVAKRIDSELGQDSLRIDAIYCSPHQDDFKAATALQTIFNATSGKDIPVIINPELRVFVEDEDLIQNGFSILKKMDNRHECALVVTEAADIRDVKLAFGKAGFPSPSEATILTVEGKNWPEKSASATMKTIAP